MRFAHRNNIFVSALYHSGMHLTLYKSLRRVSFGVLCFSILPIFYIKRSMRFTGLKRAQMSHAVNWKIPKIHYKWGALYIASERQPSNPGAYRLGSTDLDPMTSNRRASVVHRERTCWRLNWFRASVTSNGKASEPRHGGQPTGGCR